MIAFVTLFFVLVSFFLRSFSVIVYAFDEIRDIRFFYRIVCEYRVGCNERLESVRFCKNRNLFRDYSLF